MPPANSPVDSTTPWDFQTPQSRISFSNLLDSQPLTSPVVQLASTVGYENQAGEDMEAENVAFLRASSESAEVMSAQELTRELRAQRRGRDVASMSMEDRLNHDMEELDEWETQLRNPQPEPPTTSSVESPRSAYGYGAPSQQNLFDWAPGGETETEEMESEFAELLRQQPNTHPEILRVLARARTDSNHEVRNRAASRIQSLSNQPHEPSLRSAAILTSFRRSHRILARSRDFMSRLATSERDSEVEHAVSTTQRSNNDPITHSRARSDDTAATNRYAGMDIGSGRLAGQGSHQTTSTQTSRASEQLETLHRRYLENPSSKVSEFERIIKQLHDLRTPEYESERHPRPLNTCASPDKPPSWSRGELHTHAGSHLAPTSWLVPGALFVGTQQANPSAHSSAATMYRLVNSHSRASHTDQASPARNLASESSRPNWLRDLTASELLSLYSRPTASVASHPAQGRWTVNVSIYNVDYNTMTLQGTMEAFNVPPATHNPSTPSSRNSSDQSLPPPTRGSPSNSPFCTYVEGELIDMTTHTLLTESNTFGVKTSPDVDALYWRRLEPFSKLTDDHLTRALLDPKWIEEELMGKYVLMRWKERCFVKPINSNVSHTSANNSPPQPEQPRPHSTSQNRNSTTSFLSGPDGHGYGLSISGFYYVSLRRSDGKLEGFYFDPQSSPYQHLEMKPREGCWGAAAWSFR